MRHRPGLRRSLTAAAAVGLLLTASACGEDSPASSSADPSASSGAAADADYEAGDEVANADFLELMRGAIDSSTTARMTMEVDLGGQDMQAEGQVDYTVSPPEMQMSLTSGALSAEPIEMILVDETMYMDMGSLSNGKYVSFDLSDPSALPPGMGGLTDQLDPLSAFEDFEPALDRVVYEGADDVDGEELDRYTVTVDPSELKALQELPAGAGMPETVTYELWFGDESLMRAMSMELPMAQPVEIDARIFDWGEPVDITAPDAKDVVSMAELGGAAG